MRGTRLTPSVTSISKNCLLPTWPKRPKTPPLPPPLADAQQRARQSGQWPTAPATPPLPPPSAFAQQLALDRRTGELAPHQEVTAVYLRNAAAAIDKANEGRQGFRNPYSGPVMDRAVAYLEATGRGRADIRL